MTKEREWAFSELKKTELGKKRKSTLIFEREEKKKKYCSNRGKQREIRGR